MALSMADTDGALRQLRGCDLDIDGSLDLDLEKVDEPQLELAVKPGCYQVSLFGECNFLHLYRRVDRQLPSSQHAVCEVAIFETDEAWRGVSLFTANNSSRAVYVEVNHQGTLLKSVEVRAGELDCSCLLFCRTGTNCAA